MKRLFQSRRGARSAWLTALLTMTLASFIATPVWADKPAEVKAQELATAAKAAFKAGQFTQAAMLFKQAYAQVPRPTLLFNSARAYQKGGQLREALPLFRLYLTLATGTDEHSKAGRAEAVEHISEIEKTLAQQSKPAPNGGAAAQTPPATSSKPAVATAPSQPAAQPPATESATVPSTVAPKPAPQGPPMATPQSSPKTPAASKSTNLGGQPSPGATSHIAARHGHWSERKVLAVTLLSGGGALVLGGLVMRLVGASVGSDIDALVQGATVTDGVTFYPNATQQEVDSLASQQAGFETGGTLMLGLGLVSAAVGGYFWWTKDERDGRLTFSPSWNGAGMTWTLSGRF